jgi:hypothetical protein
VHVKDFNNHTVQLQVHAGVAMVNIAMITVAALVVLFQYIQLAVITLRVIVRVLVAIEIQHMN